MIILSRNPRSAPAQPATSPVRGIARVTQMLGRVANRVRTALTRTKATTQPPQQAPKQAEAPSRRQPKTQPATPQIDEDLFADFCNAETIGEIFASFCRILHIDERSPLYPAKLIAITQTPEQFAATRKQDSAQLSPQPSQTLRAHPTRPRPPATQAQIKQRPAQQRPPEQRPPQQRPPQQRTTSPHPSRPLTRTTRAHDPPKTAHPKPHPITPKSFLCRNIPSPTPTRAWLAPTPAPGLPPNPLASSPQRPSARTLWPRSR